MFPLAEISGGTLFFMAVVALTAGLLLMRTQRNLSKSNQPPKPHHHGTPSKHGSSTSRGDAPPKNVNREIERWEVRMHDLARELSATLDSKMSALQHLIRDADERIARLEGLIEHAKVTRSEPGRTDSASPQMQPPHVPTQAAALSGANFGQRTPLRPMPQVSRPAPDRRYEQIYSMADAGHDLQAIARHVGSPIGEVELILSLRQKP